MRDLTDKEEAYAQARAMGRTKTDSAKIAYPDSNNPKQLGYAAEKREVVADRIRELKLERAENSSLDVDEQIRRYNELYFAARDKGQLAVAAKMLERIDTILGFNSPTTSLTLKGDLTKTAESLKGDDLKKDIDKFKGILGKHSESKDATKH